MFDGVTYADLGYGKDVAPATMSLREGWHDLESDASGRFRRIEHQARALLASVGTVYRLTIDIEPADAQASSLSLAVVVDETLRYSNRIDGRMLLRVILPPGEPGMRRISLRVAGGSARIFRFAALPFPRDVLPVWCGFRCGGGGWYPLEESETDLFRYVNREAEIVVAGPERSLELDVEPGPGVAHAPFDLDVCIDRRELLCSRRIERRTRMTLELPESSSFPASLILRCKSGGRPTPPDARLRDFRLFAVPEPGERSEFLPLLASG